MLSKSKSVRWIVDQIDIQLGGKLHSPVEIQLTDVPCHFCGKLMDESSDQTHSAQCPECETYATETIGEFVESVTYVDPSDHKRWWKHTI